MKIRNDYVSNSSSSSYVIMGQTSTVEGLRNLILKHYTESKLLELVKENCDWSSIEEVDDLFDGAGNISDVIEALNKGISVFIEGDGSADDDNTVAIGIDIENAADSKTILDLKKDFTGAMEVAGLEADISKVRIIPCSEDSGGFTTIEISG